ncbi:hypothetical protein D1AOALGA4SA_11072 [Olavius algarvensis Delta 1 endosymbiont]|nr:hypothetical protein D1AOALGA4SA_11072 [Olavius algarvensis Delta 1 endosymbiont]
MHGQFIESDCHPFSILNISKIPLFHHSIIPFVVQGKLHPSWAK